MQILRREGHEKCGTLVVYASEVETERLSKFITSFCVLSQKNHFLKQEKSLHCTSAPSSWHNG